MNTQQKHLQSAATYGIAHLTSIREDMGAKGHDDGYSPAMRRDMDNAIRLIAAAPKMLEALQGAAGYLLNAKIDLETGAPKRAAIQTIEGGIKLVRAAIKAATGEE